MNKLLMIIIVSLLLVGLIMVVCSKYNGTTIFDTPPVSSGESETKNSGNNGEETPTPTVVTKREDGIVINQVSDMTMAKLAVESRVIEKQDLPSDIRFLADVIPVDNAKLTHISTYYIKSDYTQEAYNVLHDYICSYFDEENEKNLRISASREGAPLRDYRFISEKEPSYVHGVEVIISQYEDKYIANFAKGRYQFDVETNGLGEEELLHVIETVIDNTLVL